MTADWRVPTFFDWFGTPRTILVLGSGNGAPVSQLGRDGATVRVLEQDAELEPGLSRFDAVFCVDLLHRLAAPWRLFSDVARVSDSLLLGAHYWAGGRVEEHEGRRGGWVDGGFWLTRPALLEELTANGWAVRYVADESRMRSRPKLLLGCVKP